MTAQLPAGKSSKGVLLYLKVKPRSSRSAVEGLHGDRLSVSLNSPPDKGRANKELLKLLSDALRVPLSDLEITGGTASRNKTVLIHDISLEETLSRLNPG